jgi:hypothetical protein
MWLVQRGDDALGLLPQAFLPAAEADSWNWFWLAARTIDDWLDEKDAHPPATWPEALAHNPRAADALERFEATIPRPLRTRWRGLYETAWAATLVRNAWRRPPSWEDYERSCKGMAGLPLRVLFGLSGLLDADEAADALALSIQLGDDVRDLPHDAAAGRWTWPMDRVDEAVEKTLSCYDLAVDALPDVVPEHRMRALAPFVLWRHALVTGQVAPGRGHLDASGILDAQRRPVGAVWDKLIAEGAPALRR